MKRLTLGVACMILASQFANTAIAAKASRSDAGALNDDTRIASVTLSDGKGVSARVFTRLLVAK